MSEITIELRSEAEAEFYDIVDYYKKYDQMLVILTYIRLCVPFWIAFLMLSFIKFIEMT